MKKLISLIVCILITISLVGCEATDEKNAAMARFEEASEKLDKMNEELDALVEESQKLIQSEEKALDENLRPALETAVSEAKAVRCDVPDMPKKTEEINEKSSEIEVVDYTNELTNLNEAFDNLDVSIKKYALVNAPEEAYVISCLGNIEGILDISAVTEDNDPNGHLGKAGGYTATVYFTYELVDLSQVFGETVIDKGTDGGGAVEVYANEDDANKRNDYLASFDGGVFASGSHRVVGTCILRTSDKLTASQQTELETKMIEALTMV